MSGAHEGCSQGKSVGDREGSKHSTDHCGHSGKGGRRGRRVATGLDAAHFCARRWLRTRHPRLTPSPCSRTGSDALVGIIVVAKEEPSTKRGHSDACASAGGVRTATLARAPRRPLHERSRASREGPPGAFGTGQTSSVLTSYILGPEVHASVTCVGFTNDPHSLICRKATRLVSP